ncbi:hypothetical protein BAE44_0001586 [Dichanthelium oligosanthes]|uniref:Uncharacterized protein n=1 Tax=Dichanthelium oligosanthes TaxID=888268 RepID=A0A1E5WJ91_9POAL|nr:hypothetical protein BAE44_0001586 [Dichanthelium oligosanthes]
MYRDDCSAGPSPAWVNRWLCYAMRHVVRSFHLSLHDRHLRKRGAGPAILLPSHRRMASLRLFLSEHDRFRLPALVVARYEALTELVLFGASFDEASWRRTHPRTRSAPTQPCARCCRRRSAQLQLAVCPRDSSQWEIRSAVGRLHCAVRADGNVMVFRLNGHGAWEAAATVSVAEILQRPWPPYLAYELTESDNDDAEVGNRAEQERTGAIAVVVANRFQMPGDDMRLLLFQGTEVEVVLLASDRRVVAFDAVTWRWREAILRGEPAGTDWGATSNLYYYYYKKD